MALHIEFDPEANAIYVRLRHPDEGVRTDHSDVLDGSRRIEVDRSGEPVAIEILDIDRGIDFEGLPRAEELREALRRLELARQPA